MIGPRNISQYCDMYDFVYVNEKWFYLTCNKQCYIWADNEIPHLRVICNKGNAMKVMFLYAIARITTPQNHGVMANWGSGQCGYGNQWNNDHKIALEEHSCVKPSV